jgi:Ca2+-binding RTX toxin-like protein
VRLGGGATVTNDGLISGGTGLLTGSGVSATIRLTNSGTIEGTGGPGTAAVLLGFGNDVFINSGLVRGGVQTSLGNDVYDGAGGRVRGAIDLGAGSDTGEGGDRADVFVAQADDGNDVFYGGGGFDTYDAAGENLRGLTVDLGKGVARFGASGAIDILDGFERATGGGGADALLGTDRAETLTGNGGGDRLTGRGGRDYLFGGTGNDRLDGGDGSDVLTGQGGDDVVLGGTGDDIIIAEGGRDTMTGGTGADDFIFTNLERDSSRRYIPDRITDFQVGTDDIDLSAFDANSQVAGNQTFTFVGTGAATLGACGYTVQGGVTRVWIYAEAGPSPVKEVILELAGTLVLTAGDFVL